jgi:endoglucanase
LSRRALFAVSLGVLLAVALQACSTAPLRPSATIQVNQVGFLPAAAKWAAVPVNGATSFAVVDARSGREVWRGALGSAAVWAPSQEAVRLADFSVLQTPGEYQLHVDGLADSPRFTIAGDAYAALNAAAIRAYYYNRASAELRPEHAGAWARPAGHPDEKVLVHASAAGPTRAEGTVISAPKGWYDAGDYNKYVVNSGITVYTLLAAYEHFPQIFQQQALNIPESGNGIPDLLDEALWNLDWMLAMQDPADGGVYSKLTNKGFDGAVMPHQATGERYVVMKTTAATLDFAAVMAQASRVFAAFDAQRPGLSARMLAAAKAAWTWAQAHPALTYRQPPDIHTGEYGEATLSDEFAWAAAELYVTTRDDAYLAAMKPAQVPMAVPGWGDVAGLGWISLAHHREHLTPAADRTLIEQRITGLASQLADAWQASAYRVAMQTSDFIWASNSAALNQAMVLVQGYRLTHERRLLDAAQAALDYVLGRNPLGMSMVTGIGTRSPMHPHHRPSQADGVAAPVPGFIVGGPNLGQQDAADCPVPYASKLPALSYLDHDCSYASNEVAINWNASLVYVSAALQALTPASRLPRLPGLPTHAVWQNETADWTSTDQSLTLTAGKKTDWFAWPGGGYHVDSAPRLLFKADSDFSFSTTVGVSARKTYDAGCVALYGTATHWAKLCLEAQASGGLSVVSVVTRGLSDDVTSFPVAGSSTHLKAAKDHGAIFFYASQDGNTWEIVRKFNLESPDGLWVGLCAQSPDGDGATAHFTNVHYGVGPVNLWSLQ